MRRTIHGDEEQMVDSKSMAAEPSLSDLKVACHKPTSIVNSSNTGSRRHSYLLLMVALLTCMALLVSRQKVASILRSMSTSRGSFTRGGSLREIFCFQDTSA
jgi:hypothetical protein